MKNTAGGHDELVEVGRKIDFLSSFFVCAFTWLILYPLFLIPRQAKRPL